MKSLAILLAVPAIALAVWAAVAAYRMGGWLVRHGVEVNWFWYRVTMPWYVHRYRIMTTERDGRPGPLYAQFLIAINGALVLAVATIVALAVGGGR